MTTTGKMLAFSPDRAVAITPALPAEDMELVTACARGDLTALGILFDRHGGAARRFLARYVAGHDADLDDLVNATFLEVFRGAKGFRGSSSVRSWVLGVSVNVSRHWRRGEARRRSFLSVWGRHDPEGGPRPDQLIERQQIATNIEGALAGLPAHLRAAFLLCEVEELSGREAAQALGVPVGTLGRHLHEARTALRAALEGLR